MTVTSLSLSFC